MNLQKLLSGYRIWIFALIPIGLLYFEILYIHHGGLKFLWSTDPEYVYLFNGITLAHLHPNLNAVGHPGTPIQCLIALVAWFVHLLRPGQPLWNDVMLHPELYIKAALYTFSIINATVLFLLGRCVYRYSRDFYTSLILQLTPFAFVMTLEVTYRLMPEAIMVSIVSMWIILLVKMIYEPAALRNYRRYCVLFALLFGFSLSDKLTFLPYFVLPLIILPGWKLQLRYTAISMGSFLLFAFPVMFNFDKFIKWVTGIFMHKGVYGGGEKGIVDWQVFSDNLQVMFHQTYPVLIPLGLLIVVLLVYVFMHKKQDIVISISTGLIGLFLISYLITAKHYAFYYMTPVLLLSVFTAFMAMQVAGKLIPFLNKYMGPQLLVGLFALILLVTVVPRSLKQLKSMHKNSRIMEEAYNHFAPELKDPPKIISTYYYGCSSLEYGLLFGLFESGKHGRYLTNIFNQLYPETYIFFPWSKLFYQGVYDVKPSAFLTPNTDYKLYVADYSETRLNEVLTALQDSVCYKYHLKEIYHSPSTSEAIFMLSVMNKVDAVSDSASMN